VSWVEHAVLWHVYPLGFVGAPIRDAPGPGAAQRLPRLTAWLDYAVELGVSGLSLGPVFTSTSHGYDSTDQFSLDPRLGTDEDLDAFLAACRQRGLHVVLDGVFNHVGDRHPFYLEALRDGPGSRYAEFFRIDFDAPGGPRAADFEGHGSLVALDHASPAVARYVSSVLEHWLERGVDGWRLDAAYAVDPAFWRAVLPGVRERHPGAWFVGEVIHGDYAGFVEASGVDSVTQYELWKAVWSALSSRNFFELDWTLTRHGELLERFLPHTFVGNHDVTRIASRVGAPAAVLALVVLMTTGGVPAVYYGDEQGFTGVKEDRLGGDDAVRPAFPADPSQLSPLGEWLHRSHQELIGLRRRHPWLVRARTQTLELTNERYAYRTGSGEEFLTVELDVTDGAHALVRSTTGEVLFRHDA
jgi:cyclomaltodextrinase